MRDEIRATTAREQIFTVQQLNQQVRGALERVYGGIRLEAEVSECTRAASGHLYFRLCDPGGKAQIDAVMWRSSVERYGKVIQRGARLVCVGKVTLYEAGGKYQFVAQRAEDAGAGDRARALAMLKSRLAEEGLFDPARKRPLPSMPACVGVVTSRSGAAIRDIVEVMSRRFPTRVVLAHAQVQGDGAPGAIEAAIDRIGAVSGVEVVIVGRGGGSAEDLDAFNDERVVRALARCPVPVISAVGHEVDVTLSDLVADRRAATPSEAAELVVPEREQLAQRLDDLLNRIVGLVRGSIRGQIQRQATIAARLAGRDPRHRLRMQQERLMGLRHSLGRWPGVLKPEKEKLQGLRRAIDRFAASSCKEQRALLEGLQGRLLRCRDPLLMKPRGEMVRLVAGLEALSPLSSIARGYAIVKDSEGRIVKSPVQAPAGTELEITLAQGTIGAVVTRSEENR